MTNKFIKDRIRSVKKQVEPKRYLVSFDSRTTAHVFTDVLVMGSGVAGLSAAIQAARCDSVLVVTKERIDENNTAYAQGGVAVVLSAGDTVSKHIKDTLDAGQGLCDAATVKAFISEGPRRVNELIAWGALFDKENDRLVFTQEGGHHFPRIIHAQGDSTGKEIEQTLIAVARENKNIKVFEHTFVIDLITEDGICHGAIAWHAKKGSMLIWAKRTILATGGCGQVYRETTNPGVATGDGLAMAYRAGATLQDMEFVQFHPTTLYIAGAVRFLITETVRGEGGILRNKRGERFMPKYHPQAELAPRDVVSQSILKEMQKTDRTHVYIDIRHIPKERLYARFPRIREICASFGIDIAKDLIPVRPSAHYMIGGVKVNRFSRTTIRHLYACGEVACTGMHGANRLGSNSLLEGLVAGSVAGADAGKSIQRSKRELFPYPIQELAGGSKISWLDLNDIGNSLKSLMWRDAGIERDEKHLLEAEEMIEMWCRYVMDKEFANPAGWELQNMLLVSRLIVVSARKRKESRGVHHRSDYPETDNTHWKRHITVKRQKS
ncbi:MAG: L-aspartate oxidase [Candidatus Brocadia sp.]|nr:L-aspartate oxidase [Candidatus Brocadia fulgida]UJS19841.1 MAG: L-aspartate oxidase [Candidatus Brocadia sp.]